MGRVGSSAYDDGLYHFWIGYIRNGLVDLIQAVAPADKFLPWGAVTVLRYDFHAAIEVAQVDSLYLSNLQMLAVNIPVESQPVAWRVKRWANRKLLR